MSDEKLRQLLSALPGEEELSARAARARGRALARLEDRAPAARGWLWAPGLALVLALVAGTVWLGRAWRVEPLGWKPPAPVIAVVPLKPPAPLPVEKTALRRAPPALQRDRLRMQFVLSDGTRVLWTFDKDFNL